MVRRAFLRRLSLCRPAHHAVLIVHVDGDELMMDCAFAGPTPMRPISLHQLEPIATLGGDGFSMRHETLPNAAPEDQLGARGHCLYRHTSDGAVPWVWINPCVRLNGLS